MSAAFPYSIKPVSSVCCVSSGVPALAAPIQSVSINPASFC
jgi:hypothetical protein